MPGAPNPSGSSTFVRVHVGADSEPEPTSSDPSESATMHEAGDGEPHPIPIGVAAVPPGIGVALQLEPPAAGFELDSTVLREIPTQKPVDGQSIPVTSTLRGVGAVVQARLPPAGFVDVARL